VAGAGEAAVKPDVSVVVATFNRARRLESLLEGLRRQRYPLDRFEVVIVDDGSSDETAEVLDRERRPGELALRAVTRNESSGPATARDEGWRAAAADLIAFTDDDCVPDRDWLAAGVRACAENPGGIVQGRTEPLPEELGRLGPFSRTISVPRPDATFQTCNVFYPRALLERLGGFDTQGFDRAPGGEDSDLAWRAIEAGTRTTFAESATVYHAVNQLGPVGKLRVAARWTTPMLAYARHAELRRARFVRGIFWKPSHYLLVRALLAALLPRRWRLVRVWLAGPYAVHLAQRGRIEGGGLPLAPYFALHDLVELTAVARAAVRYRTPML
jgi:GT2 family glycosyltransferase